MITMSILGGRDGETSFAPRVYSGGKRCLPIAAPEFKRLMKSSLYNMIAIFKLKCSW